jgi:hypothetical protein
MTRALFDELDLSGSDGLLQLNTIQGVSYENSVIVEGLVLSDPDDRNPAELPKVFVKDMIPVGEECIARADMCDEVPSLTEFVHLLPPHFPEASIGILLGCNTALLEPISVRSSASKTLCAVRYKHGWTVQGFVGSTDNHCCNRIVVKETCKEVLVPHQILKLLESDFDEKRSSPDECGPSLNDQKFLKIVDGGIQFQDGHFVVPLPLKDRDVVMLNNRPQAMKRLEWQTKKMLANDAYRSDYVDFMSALMDKGYCERVIESDDGDSWFLPHHGVYHPQKKKIRVVFDCSARCSGFSLNDHLLHGPDLSNSITGVLTRFRFDLIAFVADLEAMFYQVRVP